MKSISIPSTTRWFTRNQIPFSGLHRHFMHVVHTHMPEKHDIHKIQVYKNYSTRNYDRGTCQKVMDFEVELLVYSSLYLVLSLKNRRWVARL